MARLAGALTLLACASPPPASAPAAVTIPEDQGAPRSTVEPMPAKGEGAIAVRPMTIVGKNGSIVLEFLRNGSVRHEGREVGRIEANRIVRADGEEVCSVAPNGTVLRGSKVFRFEGAKLLSPEGNGFEVDAEGVLHDGRGQIMDDVRVVGVREDTRRTAVLLWASTLPLLFESYRRSQ
jgi:hypothetical protein